MLNSWGLGLRVEMHLLKEVVIVNLYNGRILLEISRRQGSTRARCSGNVRQKLSPLPMTV